MKSRFGNDTSLKPASRRMQASAHAERIQDRKIRSLDAKRRSARVRRYLSISREVGAGGGEIARLVGARLGWLVLDDALLDRLAKRYRQSRSMLELVDETRASWIHDVLGSWFDRKLVPHEKYVVQMSRTVLAVARRRNVVLVGRGMQFLLPRDRGLAIRVIAPEDYRVRTVMSLRSVDVDEARRYVHEVDEGRRHFVRRYFHHDVDDPRLYDLVLRIDRFDVESASELVAAAIRHQEARTGG